MDEIPTMEGCLRQAIRLLVTAEMEMDREMMDKRESLARSWMMAAELIGASSEAH